MDKDISASSYKSTVSNSEDSVYSDDSETKQKMISLIPAPKPLLIRKNHPGLKTLRNQMQQIKWTLQNNDTNVIF